jgi:hypothetical protein
LACEARLRAVLRVGLRAGFRTLAFFFAAVRFLLAVLAVLALLALLALLADRPFGAFRTFRVVFFFFAAMETPGSRRVREPQLSRGSLAG